MLRAGQNVKASLLYCILTFAGGAELYQETGAKLLSYLYIKLKVRISLLSIVGKFYAIVLITKFTNETEEKVWFV